MLPESRQPGASSLAVEAAITRLPRASACGMCAQSGSYWPGARSSATRARRRHADSALPAHYKGLTIARDEVRLILQTFAGKRLQNPAYGKQ